MTIAQPIKNRYNQPTQGRCRMKKSLLTLIAGLVAVTAMAQINRPLPMNTNWTVNATDSLFVSPASAYGLLSFCNDGASTIYLCPGFLRTNIFSVASSNSVRLIVTNIIPATAVVGQGIRLNANGGCVVLGASDKAGTIFHGISSAGVNNVSITITPP